MFSNIKTLTMDWYLPSPKWIFLINATLILPHVSVAKTLASVLWDKYLFQRNGPEGLRIEAEVNDVIDVICPQINDTLGPRSAQFHKFTQVSRLGYENCDLLQGGGAKTLLQCNRPDIEHHLRLLLQEHAEYPGDPVFRHGRDYYFTTTSDGTEEGINQISGGLCQTHYMKLIIHMNGEGTTDIPSSFFTSPSESRKSITTVKPTRSNVTNTKPIKEGNGVNGSSHQSPSSMLFFICSFIVFVRWQD